MIIKKEYGAIKFYEIGSIMPNRKHGPGYISYDFAITTWVIGGGFYKKTIHSSGGVSLRRAASNDLIYRRVLLPPWK